jgi:hypothetical protein
MELDGTIQDAPRSKRAIQTHQVNYEEEGEQDDEQDEEYEVDDEEQE